MITQKTAADIWNAHREHPALAESVIRAHIGRKHAELVEANERARIELSPELYPHGPLEP